ncbi:MAG TPA: hypothetical protein VG963_26825 [Polyangiaceae bacterium]|nr:hypothetical protein [Polyangiaceae bacterium]
MDATFFFRAGALGFGAAARAALRAAFFFEAFFFAAKGRSSTRALRAPVRVTFFFAAMRSIHIPYLAS